VGGGGGGGGSQDNVVDVKPKNFQNDKFTLLFIQFQPHQKQVLALQGR